MNTNGRTSAHVQLGPDELIVTGLTLRDRRVLDCAHRAAERGEDLGDWVTSVLVAGAAAVTAAGAGTDLARIDAALDKVHADVETTLRAALGRFDTTLTKATDPSTGDLARAAQEAVDRLASGVQRILTGSDALLPEAAARAVNQVTAHALAEVHRLLEGDRRQLAQLISHDRERAAVELAGAITAQNSHLGEVVAQLRDSLATSAVQDARSASGPRKGLTFESQVLEAVHDVAAAGGDGGADSVGAVTGTDGSRKGDVLVVLRSLPSNPKLVVEAKSRPGKPLGPRQWAEELEASLRARTADVALGVCPPEQMPGSGHVLVIDNRRVVVAWSPETGDHLLNAVYLLLRMTAGARGRGVALSAAQLDQHVQSLLGALSPLDEIQRQAAAARRAAEKIDAAAVLMRTDLRARIDQVQQQLDQAA